LAPAFKIESLIPSHVQVRKLSQRLQDTLESNEEKKKDEGEWQKRVELLTKQRDIATRFLRRTLDKNALDINYRSLHPNAWLMFRTRYFAVSWTLCRAENKIRLRQTVATLTI